MHSSVWFAVGSLVGLAACSSSSNDAGAGGPGTSNVTGTYAGASIATTNTVGVAGPLTVQSNGVTVMGYEALVAITDLTNSCEIAQSQSNPPNAATLSLVVGSATPVVAGTYAISNDGVAQMNYSKQDAACNTTVNDTATDGSITLTTVTSTAITGTFQATFTSGDRVSGSFDAPICNVNLSTIGSNPKACGG